MNDDEINQNIGSISPDVEHVLIETNKGNGVIISQLPSIQVSFQVRHPDGTIEKEVGRHSVDLKPDEIKAFQDLPDTHTLGYDKISKSIITKPKKTMPNIDTPAKDDLGRSLI